MSENLFSPRKVAFQTCLLSFKLTETSFAGGKTSVLTLTYQNYGWMLIPDLAFVYLEVSCSIKVRPDKDFPEYW